jgi:hypothetical protein
MVAHACNPSYSGDRSQDSDPAGLGIKVRPYLKNNYREKKGGVDLA